MGILNQLRNEANQKKEENLSTDELKNKLEQNYQQRLLPKMQFILQFMNELIEHLNYLDNAIKIESYSKVYPQFGLLQQSNYKINTDGFVGFVDLQKIMQINISFDCSGEGIFFVKKKGKIAINQEIAFLNKKKIKFQWNPAQMLNEIANIKIYRQFPISFHFIVDYEQSQIKFHIKNHSEFDSYTKYYQANEINEMLLDEIARFVLRKDCDLIRLSISKEQKQEIKNNFDEYNAHQMVLEQQVKRDELEEQKVDKKGFLSRLKSFAKS